MNLILQAYQKRAGRAARRGDVRAADAIELEYIKSCVKLYSPRADDNVPAACTRMCRGAGENGETLLEWQLPNGDLIYSDMDASVLPEYEDDACRMLVNFNPGRVLELLPA
jgi:hypothetical protein